MAEGLFGFLGRDLRETLEAGFRRTPTVCSDGGAWLIRVGSIGVLVGLTLFLFCGYQGGFSRLNALAAQIPDWIWQWITVLGDERVAFALSLFFTRRHPRVFWTLIVAALIAVAFTHSLKPLVSAPRPPAVLEAGTFYLVGPGHRKMSFPSGHTVTATVFFGVWIYYVRSSWRRVPLVLLLVAAGLSRVAVGVHWPIDVAVAVACGAMAVLLGVWSARWGESLGMDASIHLALVTLAAVMAVSLLLWDGGYSAAGAPQQLLGMAALGYVGFAYLVDPIRRWFALGPGAG